MQARWSRLGLVLAVSAAMVVGAAGIGGASVEARGNKKKFCEQSSKVTGDIDPSGLDPSGLSEETAAELERGFKRLVKPAPSKSLSSAVKTMSSYFGEIADGTDPEDISAGDYEDYGIASAKWATYLATKCLGELIPDITLPDDIDLPDITLHDFDS